MNQEQLWREAAMNKFKGRAAPWWDGLRDPQIPLLARARQRENPLRISWEAEMALPGGRAWARMFPRI